MKKLNKLIVFVLLIFLIPLFNSISFAWWNTSWPYRRKITITEKSGNTLTDFQVAINLTYDSDMKSDFSDIRFTWLNETSNEEIEIPYWIEEKVDSSWAYVWIKVPEIPANDNATVYVYYGNLDATSKSNAEEVFDLYDDFEGTDIDTNKWYSNGAYVSNGKCILDGDSSNSQRGIKSKTTFQSSYIIIELYTRRSGSDDLDPVIWYYDAPISGSNYNPDAGGFGFWMEGSADHPDWAGIYIDGSKVVDFPGEYKTTEWTKIVFRPASGKLYARVGDTEISGSNTHSYSDQPIAITINSVNDINLEIDWVRVRKYTYPEPTYSIGSEETSNQPPEITIYSPKNETYFTTKIYLNFTVTDDHSTTFHVKAYLNDNLIYENTSYQNDILITIDLSENITKAGNYNVTVWANDTDANAPRTSEQTVYFTVEDYEIESIVYNNQAYETSNETFKIIFRVNFDLVDDIDSELIYNNNSIGIQDDKILNSTHITNVKYYELPLVEQNATQFSFYFKNNVTYTNGTTIQVNSTENNQTILWAYWVENVTSDRTEFYNYTDVFYLEKEAGDGVAYSGYVLVKTFKNVDFIEWRAYEYLYLYFGRVYLKYYLRFYDCNADKGYYLLVSYGTSGDYGTTKRNTWTNYKIERLSDGRLAFYINDNLEKIIPYKYPRFDLYVYYDVYTKSGYSSRSKVKVNITSLNATETKVLECSPITFNASIVKKLDKANTTFKYCVDQCSTSNSFTFTTNSNYELKIAYANLTVSFKNQTLYRTAYLPFYLYNFHVASSNPCNYVYGMKEIYNFTTKDEVTFDAFNANATIYYSYKICNATHSYGTSFNNVTNFKIYYWPDFAQNYPLDVYLDLDVQYLGSSDDYVRRNYYITNALIPNETINIDLYSLPTTTTNLGAWKVTVKDEYGNAVPNAIVKVLRFYPSEGIYRLVAMGKTNSVGEAIIYLIFYDVKYKIIIEKDNQVYVEDVEEQITSDLTYTLPSEPLQIFSTFYNINYNLTQENNTLTVKANDVTGNSHNFCLEIYELSLGGWKLIKSTCASTSSFEASYTFNDTNKTYYAKFLADDNVITGKLIEFIKKLESFMKSTLLFTIIAFAILLGLGVISPHLTIVLSILLIIVFYYAGFIYLSVSSLIALIFVLAILLLR